MRVMALVFGGAALLVFAVYAVTSVKGSASTTHTQELANGMQGGASHHHIALPGQSEAKQGHQEKAENLPSFDLQMVMEQAPPTLRQLLSSDKAIEQRVDQAQIMQLAGQLMDDQRQALRYQLVDSKEPDVVRHHMAVLLIEDGDRELIPALVTVLHKEATGSRFRAFAVQHLGVCLRDQGFAQSRQLIETQMIAALEGTDLACRREALLALVRARHPRGKQEVERGFPLGATVPEDFSDTEGDLLIRCCRELDLRNRLPQIRLLAAHDQTAVRCAAIATLGIWKDAASLPVLKSQIEQADAQTKRAMTLAIRRIADPAW